MEYKTEMIRMQGKFVVVHFTAAVGTTIRHATVKIPVSVFAESASFCEKFEREIRRQLVENWSGLDIPEEPLF